ncbi:hypothetical protein [Desulfurococcus amylolyticus]|uniref:4-vinyl reductase 4VR domain-containing protein n=1 Tax=Desulfurococcus amylolyticus DSM 16532 TaxID=768672 RepID=I3XRR4_DESAM|nr:hypothetical protein [Desulfurococcus amylolyticus]AFL66638.1 hypothetical protein Desfe_0740 [Desulfurococcus amylolyticus DSM 16532]
MDYSIDELWRCYAILRRLFGGTKAGEDALRNIYIPTGFLLRDKPFALFDLVVRNGKGVVARVSELILSRGYSIANITTPGIVTSGMNKGRLFILVEDCDETCGRELAEALRRDLKDIVLSVEYISAFNSYVFPRNMVLYFIDARANVFTHGLLREGFREMYTYLSSTPGLESHVQSALRNMGKGIGRHLFKRWNMRIEDAGGFEEYVKQGLRFFEAIYNAMGLASRVRAYTEDYINYVIEVVDNWECSALSEAGLTTMPQITLGIIEGYLGGLLGKRVVATEEKHIRGPGESCVYTAKSLESLIE